MIKCLICSATYPMETISCSACGAQPIVHFGYTEYAPTLAQCDTGFKATYFADLARLEAGHFGFRVRNRLILWALGKYCRGFQSLLEIGCGTGYVISAIKNAFPEAQIHGSEIFTTGLQFASARQPTINFFQMDARQIPFVDEFDVIGAFDVLEHIEKDERVLQQLHFALKPSGFMLLTVPQHHWLWSPIDDYACHVRRYSAKDIEDKVKTAGFEIVRSTSFVSLLLPAMIVSRMVQKRVYAEVADITVELKISPWLNMLFEIILSSETAIIRGGIILPLGGSRMIVARKK